MLPGCSFDLSKRLVHVWTLPIGNSSNVIARCEEVLTPHEKIRAAQFRLSRPRESYILTRAALRLLLGRYLCQDPASIRFQFSSNGKPALEPINRLRFNVTHSGKMAALALTEGCDIGIDLEQLRPLPDLEQIANRYFCSAEAAEINSLPAANHERAFFNCWTRKEAFVKAIGVGLSRPLNSFRVTVKPDEPANLVFPDDETSELWTLQDLQLGPDYAGAVAFNDRQRPWLIFPIVDPEQLLNVL
jgi:4'-phosphopantetheinyl transferase